MIEVRQIARALGGNVVGRDAVLAPGPGHSASDRSLSIKLDATARDGFLVHSFAGDDPNTCRDYVRAKLGLPKPATTNGGTNGRAQGAWTLISEHIYRTEAGEPYLLVKKFLTESGTKEFPQYHWDGKQWVKGKPKGPKIPYRLPQLLAAPLTTTVYFCEGEKDADNLAKLGFVATTASEGANAKWDPALTSHFKQRSVVILPDADKPGRAHARKVAKALDGVAPSVRVVDLYPERHDGSDVSNWLERDTAGVKLAQLATEASLWEPGPEEHKSEPDADDALITELAALSRLAYAKRRKEAAETLGITAGELDKVVAEARRDTRGKELAPALCEHWTVVAADQPVDGGTLLEDLTGAIRRYVFLVEHQIVAVALWIVFSWVHDAMTHSCILFVTSAERDSGKSTLLGLINFLARRALLNVEISGASLFRSIRKWQPCLIVDEADDALDDNADLRSVINSGWTRGQGVIRCHPETHDPELFSTFAPKVVAMKGRKLPDTTLSRSIVTNMMPKRAGDPAESTEDFDHLDNEIFARLRPRLARWAADNGAAVASAEPEMPAGFHNRRRANWKPLLAIADLAGGGWKQAARKAAAAIEATHDTFDPSMGLQLLAAIRAAFDTRGVHRITSAGLIDDLVEDETGPWATYNHGKPISQRQIAGLLKPHGISPRTVRTSDDRGRGYHLDQFGDVFERYLSAPPPTSMRDTVTNEPGQRLSSETIRDTERSCHGSKLAQPVDNTALSRCHGSDDAPGRDGGSQGETSPRAARPNPPALGPPGDSLDDFT